MARSRKSPDTPASRSALLASATMPVATEVEAPTARVMPVKDHRPPNRSVWPRDAAVARSSAVVLPPSRGPPPLELLDSEEARALARLSRPSFWKAVKSGRLPAPLYPAVRTPRWVRAELEAALLATRRSLSESAVSKRFSKARNHPIDQEATLIAAE